jgi:hypothetical protein
MAKKKTGDIKQSHKGLLHKAMGIPQGKKIPTAKLKSDKAKAKNAGNTKRVKQDTYAINVRKGR